ncbi:MAG: TonB-dependent receptor [Saprospiraceae bacterium]
MSLRILVCVIFLTSIFNLNSQSTIFGKITNASGEKLDYCSVFLVDSNYATVSAEDGSYKLEGVEAGTYILTVTQLGYARYTKQINVFDSSLELNVVLELENYLLDGVIIEANTVGDNGVYAFEKVVIKDMEDKNLGQDIPILIQNLTSIQSTSDAGAGIGYTGFRIRGIDPQRINVTLNGVPLNDSESHTVFWVNMPNLSSDISNVEVQRGVGTSTLGTGVFGGAVHLQSSQFHQNPYLRFEGSLGSFNTRKASFHLGSGIINNKYSFNIDYSKIGSDGYIDRAFSDLSSINFSASRISDKSSLKLNIFTGKEKTYQAWYGVPESVYLQDEKLIKEHFDRNLGSLYLTQQDSINLFTSGDTYNYYTYKNQIDRYNQSHYQLLYGLKLSENSLFNASFNLTHGDGYYEQYKYRDDVYNYIGMPFVDEEGNEYEIGDIVRQKWLNNNFYFTSMSFEKSFQNQVEWITALSYSMYDGMHFGELLSINDINVAGKYEPYYNGKGKKSELNGFSKLKWPLYTNKLTLQGEFQVRKVNYEVSGSTDDYAVVNLSKDYTFYNPKLGLRYNVNNLWNLYASYAVGNKEPLRSDLLENIDGNVVSENLQDWELAINFKRKTSIVELNFYFMNYLNQLVPTGALNDVGAPLRENVARSYRAGLEITTTFELFKNMEWSNGLTLSTNKIKNFQYLIYDYTNGYEAILIDLGNTDIALSPKIINNSQLQYKIGNSCKIGFLTNYVGKQYLDNTSDESKALKSYFVGNINFIYDFRFGGFEKFRFKSLINNVFNTKYASNGYTYSYIYGTKVTENYVYPQAGFNVLVGVEISL